MRGDRRSDGRGWLNAIRSHYVKAVSCSCVHVGAFAASTKIVIVTLNTLIANSNKRKRSAAVASDIAVNRGTALDGR